MANATDDKRKRIHRSGALGMVLADAEAVLKSSGTAQVDTAEQTSGEGTNARVGQRFFPTKGYGRVPGHACRPWRLADRPVDEFSHTATLAKSIEANGQVQPALVRLCSDAAHPEIRYEVIAGVARWRSAMNSEADLDIQIRDLTDVQAYRAMVAENEDRQNLSDFARSKRFARALDEGVVSSKTELAEMAHLSAAQLSYFLGFASLPETVVKAIADVRAMPVRLGYALSVALREGFESEIIRDLPHIENGVMPRDRLLDMWREQRARTSVPQTAVVATLTPSAQGKDAGKSLKKVLNEAGAEICNIRVGSSGAMVFKLPARVGKRLSDAQINRIVDILKETDH
jgi:ParB/RepB/Spo0J family partition protein